MMAHVNVNWREARRMLAPPAAGLAALAGSTLLAYVLETWLGLADASPVYLLAVAAVAIAVGTMPAIATAVGSFLVYNFLFIDPRLSLIVAGPQELLTLLMLLGLGVLIGRLAGTERDRAHQAARREREARALFAISRLFSTEPSTEVALVAAVRRLALDARMERVWVGLGATEAQERVAASSSSAELAPKPATYAQLRRDAVEGQARWTRIHQPALSQSDAVAGPPHGSAYRIALAVGSGQIGSLWAIRAANLGELQLEETRLLTATADQISQAIDRERLARQAMELEVARRSDELKSALLVSVSHDLRTPLSAIRAAAGNLADPEVEIDEDQRRAAAAAIDDEAQRLNRLVGNLIDMSRIEGRDLAPDLEAIPFGDVVVSLVERLRPLLGNRPVRLVVPDDLPPVRADATLLDQVFTNLLENVARHTPPGTSLRIEASATAGSDVLVVIEDDGPGVPLQALPRLFERFYRAAPPPKHGRASSGLGLAVVRGFVEAMGGRVLASRGNAGGLRISLFFATHAGPAERPDE